MNNKAKVFSWFYSAKNCFDFCGGAMRFRGVQEVTVERGLNGETQSISALIRRSALPYYAHAMVIPKTSRNTIGFMRRTRHVSVLLMLVFCVQYSWAEEITNRLSFHLLVDDVAADELFKSSLNPSSVKFVREPILADAEFTGFDTTNHHFWTTPKTAMRLARKMELNTPFVLVALGKPIYVGVLSSPVSSRSYDVPTVWVEPELARAEPTNNIIFKIRRGRPPERSHEASKSDVRDDSRIVRAVKELGLPPSVPLSSMRYPELNGVEEGLPY